MTVGHRRGVQLGTVLAGATLATLVSFIHVSVQEGRDAEIITTYGLAGAVVGALVQVGLNRRLYPPAEAPAPIMVVSPGGGLFLGAILRF